MSVSQKTFVIALVLLSAGSSGQAADLQLISNHFLQPSRTNSELPEGFQIEGDAWYRDLQKFGEQAGWGVRLFSSADINKDGLNSANVSTSVNGLKAEDGRWFRLQIRGRAEDGFHVEQDDLYLQVEFFKDGGKTSLDHIKKRIYPQVEQYRADLKDQGTNPSLGTSTWNIYSLEFRTPFPEVDTLQLSAGLNQGAGNGEQSEFLISEFELVRISSPTSFEMNRQDPAEPTVVPDLKSLVPLGGRWYFDPQGGSRRVPRRFDHTNADQLIYLANRLLAPFAGNMSAWLRAGYLDRTGNLVEQDQFVEDSQVIEVTKTHLVIHSRNLPNHPTAIFPDRWRSLDGNPNYIQEQNDTWYLPLVPKENPRHIAMHNESNSNGALPMGPIGVALNGVVFFNPFDESMVKDAVWRLDRCCGHPSPSSQYHYHKYPVCVKTPWTDDGEAHSPLIGFAFDGYPVYGPYEAKGELARDLKSNSMNEFNVHHDDERGWHYHVKPGRFPHLIGGYWGVVEVKNLQRRPPPGRPPGGPPPRTRPPR